MTNKKILIISGATASGKSSLALEIARKINGVIINADAMQLYKELPILSAQPIKGDLEIAQHKLYSVLKYNQDSSVASWLKLAKNSIDEARNSNKVPIVVGGTGLYISKLLDGINEIPQIDPDLKNEVRGLCKAQENPELIKILLGLGDKEEFIQNLDKQRLVRRIEVLKQTGKNLSWWQSQPKKQFFDPKDFVHFNIELDRDLLYQNCNDRFKKMLNSGAMQEVEELVKSGIASNSSIAKTIGFIEIKDYLEGAINEEQLIEICSQKTRNYAKRQLTWFRNQFRNKIIINNRIAHLMG